MHVTFEQAEKAIEAAIRESRKIGSQMCITVVDSGAYLKAFVRMNDVSVGSVDIAIKKAKTAFFFGIIQDKSACCRNRVVHFTELSTLTAA